MQSLCYFVLVRQVEFQSFGCSSHLGKLCFRRRLHPGDHRIRVGGVMMKQDQMPHLGSECHFTRHCRGRVPVSLCSWEPGELSAVMCFQVLGVMDQDIRMFCKVHQPAVRAHIAFCICRVHN